MTARQNARRSLVVTRDVEKGEVITEGMLTAKRPSIGIPPNKIDEVIGLTIGANLSSDSVLMPEHIVEDGTFKRIYPSTITSSI